MIRAEADGITTTVAALFWHLSSIMTLIPFHFWVSFWISSPIFLAFYIRQVQIINGLGLRSYYLFIMLNYQTQRTHLWGQGGSSTDFTTHGLELYYKIKSKLFCFESLLFLQIFNSFGSIFGGISFLFF